MGDLHGSGGGGIVCGDCNATDPEWAGINRGLLLCNDCCFIHRSFGPQFSRIKYVKDGKGWNPKLWSMVVTLASGPANHVWEHLLLDRSKGEKESTGVKKPMPYDNLETKRKFIQLKHVQFQFVPRTNPDQVEVRSQELHSTVRTGSVDTTLRLLAGGADPNYFHPEKGTRPMHVAARNGQALQVELLFLHGAHTAASDYLGQTAMEHALAAGHKELAQRILQLRYSLTDQLGYFACNEMPDHSSSKHIVVPSTKQKNPKHEADINGLPHHLLEQLAADLYDEVDRRQLERAISRRFGPDSPKLSIAFLPVNPHYPSVRNQARQKFARLTDEELCSMISLILADCEKRHWSGNTSATESEPESIFVRKSATSIQKPSLVPLPTDDDDYPLYDSVASDEDLILAEQQTFLAQQRPSLDETSFISSKTVVPSSSCQLSAYKDNLLLTKLMETEAQVQDLQASNVKLKQDLATLQRMVKFCLRENLQILSNTEVMSRPDTNANNLRDPEDVSPKRLNLAKPLRPSSMCDLLPSPSDDNPPRHQLSKEENIRTGKLFGVTPIAQQAIQRTIELIKHLIDRSAIGDTKAMKETSREIYNVVNEMIQTLVVLREVKTRPDIMNGLEKLSYNALKLSHQVPSIPPTWDPNKDILPFIKQLCFDVGASMKEFASLVSSPPPDNVNTNHAIGKR